MVDLLEGLGFGKGSPLRWPAMGSEIILEVRSSALPPRDSLKLPTGVAHRGQGRLCTCDSRRNTSPAARMGIIKRFHRNTRAANTRQHLSNLHGHTRYALR